MTVPATVRRHMAFVAIRHWAALSYLYEIKDSPAATDAEFDELVEWMQQNFDWLKPFDINGYLPADPADLKSGSVVAHKVCGQTLEFAEYLMKRTPHPLDSSARKDAPKKVKKAAPKKPVDDDDDLEDLLG